tara:strand:+ start:459 stop:674 length:216 start_codon:yes stop_codon:yes gene_type:complete
MTKELNIGDRIKVNGWVMMKGLDDNRIYKVIKKDSISYTLRHRNNKAVRHYKGDIHLWIGNETNLNHIKML